MQLAWRVFFGGGACQLEVGEVDGDHVADSQLQHFQLNHEHFVNSLDSIIIFNGSKAIKPNYE